MFTSDEFDNTLFQSPPTGTIWSTHDLYSFPLKVLGCPALTLEQLVELAEDVDKMGIDNTMLEPSV